MKLVVKIELDNDAFQGPGGVDEVARLLQSVGERVPDPLRLTNGAINLHDLNGNWVGEAVIIRGKVA